VDWWHGVAASLLLGFAAFAFFRRGGLPNSGNEAGTNVKSRPKAESSSGPGSVTTTSSSKRAELHPFLKGDPKVIDAIQASLNRTDLSLEDRERLWDQLKDELAPLLVSHGIHALPLFSRILTDSGMPKGLRVAALTALGRLSYEQNADFLAREIASGKLCSDSAAPAVHILGRLMAELQPVLRTQPLNALCSKILEDAFQSVDPEVRSAAVEQYLSLSPTVNPATAVQRLYLILKTDPTQDVRTSVERLLLDHQDLIQGNEWLAKDAGSIVLSAGNEADRARALNLLVATGSESAKPTVLVCLGDGAERVQKLAILATGSLKIAEAVPALAKLLLDPKAADPVLRQQYVLSALAEIPGRESLAAMLACATGDVEPGLRGAAVVKLKENPAVRDERFGRSLVSLYESLPEGGTKDNALQLLARSNAPEAYETVYRLYGQAGEEARDRLGSLLLQSPRRNEFVQANFAQLLKSPLAGPAITALASAAPDRAIYEIESAYVTDKGASLDEPARHSAIRALGTIGSAKAGTVLKAILEVEEDRDLQSEISTYLDQIKR